MLSSSNSLSSIEFKFAKWSFKVLKISSLGNISSNSQLSFFELQGNSNENITELFKEDEKLELPEDYDALKELARNIKNVDINSMTPLNALEFLNNLKNNVTLIKE